jgi:hypothetical protein
MAADRDVVYAKGDCGKQVWDTVASIVGMSKSTSRSVCMAADGAMEYATGGEGVEHVRNHEYVSLSEAGVHKSSLANKTSQAQQ